MGTRRESYPCSAPAVLVGGEEPGALFGRFLDMIARHRHWTRKGKNRIGASRDRDETRGRQSL
jgi:hypothetical protein